ncbi:MAG: transcriptional repressor [Myxococcota bacterium]
MGSLTRDEARQRIHGAGLRATAPRVAVLRLLSETEKPLSHSEVVEAMGGRDWDQATLYRNLVKLADVELARVASKVGGVARYEAREAGESAHVHPHFCCKTCGAVECLPEAKLSVSVARRWNRSVKASELQLIGECPDCLAAQKSRRGPRSRKRRG